MAFMNPSKIVAELDIRPGMKVAEFGSGSGHFTIEMARRIGQSGKVYAFDVQQPALEVVEGRAKHEHLGNIEIGRVDLEQENATRLTEKILDLVLISNMLFQAEDKQAIIKEAFRVLREGGKAVVIDENTRVDKGQVTDIFLQTGFEKEKEIEVGDKHYGLIFIKHEA